MKVACTLCDKEVETKENDLYMTVRWCFDEMVKLNDLKVDKDLGRVIGVCADCWSNKLKKKLSVDDYYWMYDKEV
jgi:hypothetical protein